MIHTAAATLLGFGTLIIILQAWTDWKSHTIDSRRNWFMNGVNIATVFVWGFSGLMYLATVIVAILFGKILSKKWAEGDIGVFTWVIPNLFVVNFTWLIWFFIILITLITAQVAYGKFRHKPKMPAVPAIALAYILTGLIGAFLLTP